MIELKQNKETITLAISVLAALPILTQTIFDVFFVGPIIPIEGLFIAATIIQLTGGVFFFQILLDLKKKKISYGSIIAISSLSAWGLSLSFWIIDGEAAGAAFASLPALSIPVSLLSKMMMEQSFVAPEPHFEGTDGLLPNWAIPRRMGRDQKRVEVHQIRQGELLTINIQGLSPVDGLITEGMAQFTGDNITGDPLPRHRGPGDRVMAGEKCIGGSVVVQATRDGVSSKLYQALSYSRFKPVKEYSTKYMDKVLKPYFITSLILVFPVMIMWLFFAGGTAALQAAGALLAISGPVAIGFSRALPMFIGSQVAKVKGVVFHRSDIGQSAEHVKHLLISPIDFLIRKRAILGEVRGEEKKEEIISIALGLVKKIGHPLETALELEAAKISADPVDFKNVYFEPGRGLIGEFEDRRIVFGNPALLAQHGVGYGILNQAARDMEAKGNQAVWLGEALPGKTLLGLIEFCPVVRNSLVDALDSIIKSNISTQLMTPVPDAPFLRKLAGYYFDGTLDVKSAEELSINVTNMSTLR